MLTSRQVTDFHRDGFVNGGPCLDAAEVDELRSELQRVIDDRGRDDRPQPAMLRNIASGQSQAGALWQIVNIWAASAPYRRLLEHPQIAADVAQLTAASV